MTHGMRTIIYPVTDIARGRALFRALQSLLDAGAEAIEDPKDVGHAGSLPLCGTLMATSSDSSSTTLGNSPGSARRRASWSEWRRRVSTALPIGAWSSRARRRRG
jgi:hypothetical protein